jgi:hypothetical protein
MKMKNCTANRVSERGSAGSKFLITLAIIFLIGHAGYNYVPVAYEAESLKSEMQTAVLQGLALPGKVNPVENVKARIGKAIVQNNAPADTLVEVKMAGNALTAHVTYTKPVNILPFGIYRYDYTFDHTATPAGFLLKQ